MSSLCMLLLSGSARAAECPEIKFGAAESVVTGGADAETLDLAPGEQVVFSSEPQPTWEDNIPVVGPRPSRLNVVLNRPSDYRSLISIPLGLGEATSVAALPSGNRALVAIRDPDRPNVKNGVLKLVGFAGVLASIEVGAGPDSGSVSADGNWCVLANEAERPLFPSLSAYRSLTGFSATYATLALEVTASTPAKLGFDTIENLLKALGFKVAEDLLESAVGGGLPAKLTDLSKSLGFETFDAFAASRGCADGATLLAKVLAEYGREPLAEKLLAAKLIAERPNEDVAGSISILRIPADGSAPQVVAKVTGQTLYERFFTTEPQRAASALDIEPEFGTISSDSSFAFVTLQEQSAIAVLDLKKVGEQLSGSLSPTDIGNLALVDVILLPHGFPNALGAILGSGPDGLDISSDGKIAITANEVDSSLPTLQGISILDLRGGISKIKVAASYNVFDLAPELLEDTGLAEAPVQNPGEPFPEAGKLLPRVDPEDTEIVEIGCQVLCVVALERFEKSTLIPDFLKLPPESRRKFGSLLVLDVTDALAKIDASPPDAHGRGGFRPPRLARIDVGFGRRAPSSPPRPEVVSFIESTSTLVAANERDRGSVTFVPVIIGPDPRYLLSITPGVSAGTFDVLLTTDKEVAGLSFGLRPTGVCDSAAVVKIEMGDYIKFKPEIFESKKQGDGSTMSVFSVFSLKPPGPLVGPGQNMKIAKVSVCGSVLSPTGCEVCFTGQLGTPPVLVTIATPEGKSIEPKTACAPVPSGDALCFRRGDANTDGRRDVADPIFALVYLFLKGPSVCLDAIDSDDNGKLTVSDPIYEINWLYRVGPPPAAPGPAACGPDPSADELKCEFYETCRA